MDGGRGGGKFERKNEGGRRELLSCVRVVNKIDNLVISNRNDKTPPSLRVALFGALTRDSQGLYFRGLVDLLIFIQRLKSLIALNVSSSKTKFNEKNCTFLYKRTKN